MYIRYTNDKKIWLDWKNWRWWLIAVLLKWFNNWWELDKSQSITLFGVCEQFISEKIRLSCQKTKERKGKRVKEEKKYGTWEREKGGIILKLISNDNTNHTNHARTPACLM